MPVYSGAAQVCRQNSDTEKIITDKKILISKANASDTFRNVRVNQDEDKDIRYIVGELTVIDLRLPSGWSWSPGLWGVMSPARTATPRSIQPST